MPTTVALDHAAQDFGRFAASAPSWLTRIYHLARITRILDELSGCGAGLVADLWPTSWVLLQAPSPAVQRLLQWEVFFDKGNERSRYNAQALDGVRRSLRPRLTSFRGFSDYFVPIVSQRHADVVLVSGTFRARPLSTEEILGQWSSLTDHPTDPYDPSLAAFTRTALEIPVLGDDGVASLGQLLRILARAITDRARNPSDLEQVAELREAVFGRLPRTIQLKTEQMIDPVGGHGGRKLQPEWQAAELGIERPPNTVIAVVPVSTGTRSHGVVGALVDARTFQDRCAELGAKLKDTLSGRLENHGAYFLFHVPPQRNVARRRAAIAARVTEIAQRLRREHALTTAAGIGNIEAGEDRLPECARRAAVALSLALHRGTRQVVYDDISSQTPASPLDELPALHLETLVGAFRTGVFEELPIAERDYVQSVMIESGANSDTSRTHFSVAVDAVLAAVRKHHTVDERTLLDLRQRAQDGLAVAQGVGAQATALHDALGALAEVEREPGKVELELKLARAARFVEQHQREPLDVTRVARHVHLSNNYLSTRFKETFGVGFSAYLAQARVESARKLLATSSLTISRIAEEVGFVSIPNFNRVFRRWTGVTPSAYRRRASNGG